MSTKSSNMKSSSQGYHWTFQNFTYSWNLLMLVDFSNIHFWQQLKKINISRQMFYDFKISLNSSGSILQSSRIYNEAVSWFLLSIFTSCNIKYPQFLESDISLFHDIHCYFQKQVFLELLKFKSISFFE